MINRRDFLKLGALAVAGVFIPVKVHQKKGYIFVPAGSPETILDPLGIPKYNQQLIIPPAMPKVSEINLPDGSIADYYEITVRQFTQHILPDSMGLNPTPVWSFVKADVPGTYNYPGFTIEAQVEKPVVVKWINGLVDESGNYLPHLLPVDQTVHWANPPGPRDMEGMVGTPYNGPVPLAIHVHGAHTHEDSDGNPEAWYLPAATNLPAEYFTVGTLYDEFKAQFAQRWGLTWEPGSAIFHYPNDQRAGTTWFHDHVLGMTRLNVYAGPAAFFILRGGSQDLPAGTLPEPAPAVGDDPFGTYYEFPIAIQDRTFNTDGSLFYPGDRAFFEGLDPSQLQIPFIPDMACDEMMSDVSPIWNPEFFGNTMVVNGRTWPTVNVEKRRYRVRILNGCNSRFLILKVVAGDPAARPGTSAVPFWVIGTEGGFLPAPVELSDLVVAPAERFDVILDFTGIAEGTELYIINEGPDEPFGGGVPGVDFDWANPQTTGQVMKLVVGPIVGTDPSTPPAELTLPVITPLPPEEKTRRLVLTEADSHSVRVITVDESIVLACDDPEAEFFGPTEAHLGILNSTGNPISLGWDEPITESVQLGDTEVWEIYNLTMDAHPIHIHLIHFEVVNRQALTLDMMGDVIIPPQLQGEPRPAESWELGFKDTVIAYPGEVTRLKARFDLTGRFVWHCHIVEHEDNEMMRPFEVVQRTYLPFITNGPD